MSDENDFDMDYLDTTTDTTELKESSPCDTEYWSEIRLSHSSSTSSSYSHNMIQDETNKCPLNESDSNEDNNNDQHQNQSKTKPIDIETPNKDDKKYTGISDWISKSSLRSTGRRQSFEMLLDTSDKVKDVFAQSFQRIGIGGKSLERRNSESEVCSTENSSKDFFLFNRWDEWKLSKIRFFNVFPIFQERSKGGTVRRASGKSSIGRGSSSRTISKVIKGESKINQKSQNKLQ